MIRQYRGQLIQPGQFVNLSSSMTYGIGSRPLLVVAVSRMSVRVVDPRDEAAASAEETTRRLSSVQFVCDTLDEGNAVAARCADHLYAARRELAACEQRIAALRHEAIVEILAANHQQEPSA